MLSLALLLAVFTTRRLAPSLANSKSLLMANLYSVFRLSVEQKIENACVC